MNTEVQKNQGIVLSDKKEWEVSYMIDNKPIKLSENLVKTYFGGSNCSQEEIRNYIAICHYRGLNPFLKECYLIKYGEKSPAQIVVSRDAYLKQAEESERFNGMESGIIILRNNEIVEEVGCFYLESDTLLGGWAKVYHKGQNYPMIVRVRLQDYEKNSNTWKEYKAQMINKVAESQALRKAFPSKLSGLYTKEEMDDTSANDKVEEKKEKRQNKKVIRMAPEEVKPETEEKIETPAKEEEIHDEVLFTDEPNF